MVEMSEASAILHSATARSLVLLDEIGRGTSTYDGVSIAWAVTEHLHDAIGCKTVFATHYHELVQLGEQLECARNFNVRVREVGSEVLFLHKLEPGGADRSYGIEVGRLAGLPPAVLKRARVLLRQMESGHRMRGRRGGAPPVPDQFGLFDGSVPESPIVAALRALDPDSMTPLQALQTLVRLVADAHQDHTDGRSA